MIIGWTLCWCCVRAGASFLQQANRKAAVESLRAPSALLSHFLSLRRAKRLAGGGGGDDLGLIDTAWKPAVPPF